MAWPSQALGAFLALSLWITLSSAGEVPLGVNYGTVADDLPPPSQVVSLIQSTIITRIKLFSLDAAILTAFANSGIEVMVGVGNDQIKPLANAAYAKQWVKDNVAPFMPATKITYLSVGNEVISSSDGEMIYDLQFAMQNLHDACQAAGFSSIKITSAHSMGLLQSSVPPSNGTFGAGAATILGPILSFLARTGSPYIANAYPFFGYLGKPNSTNLQYALFNSSIPHYDNVTKLKYYNMFDAQVDAVYAAMARLGFKNITVAVGESGWPSAGDQYEPGVSLENAKTFNSNLVKHLTSGKGTPLRPKAPVETYIFALFNENLKPGAGSERNYGLFKPDMTPVYDCGIMKKATQGDSSVAAASMVKKEWCVAKASAKAADVQAATKVKADTLGTAILETLPLLLTRTQVMVPANTHTRCSAYLWALALKKGRMPKWTVTLV
ncbi:hypothetical protein GOP47_0006360 [Adiantum capillus-veneris]|uniref:glucan endo-1,3-beta-D-glucosidase n=1 Tax=Adiantum capillus-veneris TaxID=13818 RepID=A0A9D4V2Q6_ADICA|nr:hypothetical protein GOP47_0006360 [Adiantum capillus-veneris]